MGQKACASAMCNFGKALFVLNERALCGFSAQGGQTAVG
jgi:hypothetical protein